MGAELRQIRSRLTSKWVPLGAGSVKCLLKVEVGVWGLGRLEKQMKARPNQTEKTLLPKENALGQRWVGVRWKWEEPRVGVRWEWEEPRVGP